MGDFSYGLNSWNNWNKVVWIEITHWTGYVHLHPHNCGH